MTTGLELVGLTKWFRTNWTFRTVRAVDGLSLTIDRNEIFGLIGRNGAGKTTTFKLLVGLLRPTRGALLWDGAPVQRQRQVIGFAPEQPYFHDYLTVRETLNFYGQLYGMHAADRRVRIDQLADEMGLGPKMDAAVRTLSKGTLQRVAVAQAILHRPQLVILDEPMSGLDPAGRKHMRDLIAALKEEGTTVLFSSHILSDTETLCDRVAILNAGKLGEVVTIGKQVSAPVSYSVVVTGVSPHVLEVLARLGAQPPQGGPQRWTVKLKDRTEVNSALAELYRSGGCVEAVTPEYPSLEQQFLRHASGVADAD